MKESLDRISNELLKTNEEYFFNGEYIVAVHNYWIYTTVLVVLMLFKEVMVLNARDKNKDKKDINCFGYCIHNFYWFVYVASQIASVTLETDIYLQFSSHYDKNLNASLNDAMDGLEGCGGQSFGIAQDELNKPLIYERPSAQSISLILGWVILIVQLIYYFIIRINFKLWPFDETAVEAVTI